RDNAGLGPMPVGRKEPNPFGLYDMHGNVWELCANLYQQPQGPPAPANIPGPTYVTSRGGSWLWPAGRTRSASRIRRRANYCFATIGFRVCRPTGGHVPE